MQPIYLDHCSTTPIDPTVLDAMLPFFREHFANPGTLHELFGGVVQRAVRDARESVADLINCHPSELVWTSGATESNNLALLGYASKVPQEKRHVITQATEHSSVLEPCRHLAANGWQVTSLPVDEMGRIIFTDFENAIRDNTALVSIMWGNNEIGTLQPIAKFAHVCVSRGIAFHCDAAQAIGKLDINVDDVPVTMLTLSAHKFYGPKGSGALYVRDLAKEQLIAPQLFGGGQEKGIRAGTLNVPNVVGLGAASRLAKGNLHLWHQHTARLRDALESQLIRELDGLSISGDTASRLPHISNIAFNGMDNEGLLTMLPGLVASTGSACHVADFAPSHVLQALRKDPDPTDCSIRFGIGKDNTLEEIESAVKLIVGAVNRFRAMA